MTKKGVLFRLSALGGPTKNIYYAFILSRNTAVWVRIVTQKYTEMGGGEVMSKDDSRGCID